MNNELLGRFFWSFLFSGLWAHGMYDRSKMRDPEDFVWRPYRGFEWRLQRYLPPVPPTFLPLLLVCFVPILVPLAGPENVPYLMLDMFFSVFLHICIYYIFLMVLLPVLRKQFTARACATFWLVPNFLYIIQYSFMRLQKPLLVLPLPGHTLELLFFIWASGFLFVMLRGIFSHLLFRKKLMDASWYVADPQILNLWKEERRRAGMDKKYDTIMYSNAITTPLSIGLFASTIRVVLPYRTASDHPYTPDELRLILRHELIHIGHEDSGAKFFMMFCTAMCWFNPLMWKAMKYSAEDLELSCDETVLADMDNGARHQYANLLLRTAGDERGFTTCLSASAKSLKYRLQNVMAPKERWTGGLAIFATSFFLMMTCGYVALAYNAGTGDQYLFRSQEPSQYEITSVSIQNSRGLDNYYIHDHDALRGYLADLKLSRLTGNYSYSNPEHNLSVIFSTPDGVVAVTLQDERVKLSYLYSNSPPSASYYTLEPIDWDYLNSLMTPYPEDTQEYPYPPRMDFFFDELNDGDPKPLTAGETILSITNLNGNDMMKEGRKGSGGIYGVYENGMIVPEKVGVSGISEREVHHVELLFTHELTEDAFTILVENWDRTYQYEISSDELEKPFVVPLPDYSAHYTVTANLTDGERIYKMMYLFDVELP